MVVNTSDYISEVPDFIPDCILETSFFRSEGPAVLRMRFGIWLIQRKPFFLFEVNTLEQAFFFFIKSAYEVALYLWYNCLFDLVTPEWQPILSLAVHCAHEVSYALSSKSALH